MCRSALGTLYPRLTSPKTQSSSLCGEIAKTWVMLCATLLFAVMFVPVDGLTAHEGGSVHTRDSDQNRSSLGHGAGDRTAASLVPDMQAQRNATHLVRAPSRWLTRTQYNPPQLASNVIYIPEHSCINVRASRARYGMQQTLFKYAMYYVKAIQMERILG